MCTLNFANRPFVQFDATNAKHRKYYNQYMNSNSWKDCPVQFYLEGGEYDLNTMICKKVLAFYMSRDRKLA
jgi:hypothetical protein